MHYIKHLQTLEQTITIKGKNTLEIWDCGLNNFIIKCTEAAFFNWIMMSAMVNFWILFFQHVMLEEIGPLSICLSLILVYIYTYITMNQMKGIISRKLRGISTYWVLWFWKPVILCIINKHLIDIVKLHLVNPNKIPTLLLILFHFFLLLLCG